jgi:15-cis-phytoene synthase
MTSTASTEVYPKAAVQSNFYYSFLFLPRDQRQAIQRVYEFCRAVDDVSDGPLPDRDKINKMEEWRKELDRCYAGCPTHAITQSLLPSIRKFNLTRDYFEELIYGVEMDITMKRYETFTELSLYCYRVAGTVGLLCLEIFGVATSRFREYAIHLGTAVQLTNILRDLKSDGERGIIYLPQEDLRGFGYSDEEFFAQVYNERFIRLMQYECQRAHGFYEKAHALLPTEDRKRVIASLIMADIYRALLRRVESSGYKVFSEKVILSPPYKFFVAFRAWLLV